MVGGGGGGGSGGVSVEWGLYSIVLEFWLVGGALVEFLNGILMESSIRSIEVPFGNYVGVLLACQSFGWWDEVLYVLLELRLVVHELFTFSSDLLNIPNESLHRAPAQHIGWSNVAFR